MNHHNNVSIQQVQSFRLHRLLSTQPLNKSTFSTYQGTTRTKQTFKLAAINSIKQGVKFNDVSMITDRPLNKLRKDINEGQDIQFTVTHANLAMIRKKYDQILRDKLDKQTKVSKLNDELNKYKIIELQFKNNKKQGIQKVKLLQNKLLQTKNQMQESQMQKKVNQNVIKRFKSDKIIHDKWNYSQEKQLSFLNRKIQTLKSSNNGVFEQADRAAKMRDKFLNCLQVQNNQKREHLNSLESAIMNRIKIDKATQLRMKQMQQIAVRAKQDKDSREIQWNSILKSHQFLKKFLQNKMQKELKKFNLVENAFKNIKIATGVSNTNNLVNKFLSKQKIYGELLSQITQNQRKISILIEEKNDLLKINKQYKNQQQRSQKNRKEIININQQVKQLHQIMDIRQQSLLLKQRFRNWIINNLKKLKKFEKNESKKLNQERTNNRIINNFKIYIEVLQKEIQISKESKLQLEQEYIKKQDLKQKNNTLDSLKDMNKILRIKTKIKKLTSNNDQFEDEYEEQILQLNDINEQEELIKLQRIELLKQNQKFMKDLNRKRDEMKKIKIETQNKKTQKIEKIVQKPQIIETND